MVSVSRRAILAALVGLAGCVGSDSDPDRSRKTCTLRGRSQQGQGEPAAVTVQAAQTDGATCGRVAAEVALEQLDETLDVELSDPRPDWIEPHVRRNQNQYRSEIVVSSGMSSRETGESALHCPSARFAFEEALRAVPSLVTVTIEGTDGTTENSCTLAVWLVQREANLD